MKVLRRLLILGVVGFVSAALAQMPDFPTSGAGIRQSSPLAGMTSQCGWISAQVLTADGQPAPAATVNMRAMNGVTELAGHSQLQGSFDIACAPPGWYHITARSGNAQVSQEIHVGTGPQTVILRLDADSASGSAATVSAVQLLTPRKAREALKKARKQLAKSDSQGALKYIQQAINIDPDDSDAYQMLGMVQLSHQQVPESIKNLQRAIQLDSGNVTAKIMLGAALNQAKDFHQATAALESAARLAPDAWQLNYEMGRAYAGMRNWRQALRFLNRADQGNPKFPLIHYLRGAVLLTVRQYKAGVSDLRQYLHEAPNDPNAPAARQMLAGANSSVSVP